MITYKQAYRDGVWGYEVIYAGMVKFTPNKWQADIYFHQATVYYQQQNSGIKAENDEPTCEEVDN